MKRLLVLLAAGFAVAFAAEPAKEKSPGDVAADAFFKIRDDKDASIDGARIQKLQKAGIDFLATYPTHARASSVISSLAGYGNNLKDKKQQAMRDYWTTSLNYEIVNRRTKADISDDARAALTALDAAYNGYLARTTPSKDTMEGFRAKIDRLAELPGGARFLPSQERDYIHVLTQFSGKLAENQARKLMESDDKKLAAVGKEELNLIQLGRTPLDLKAPTLDGKGFDAAALRGKVIYFLFWSSTNEASVKELADQKDDYKRFQKIGVEIVTVAHDTDRAALEKFVKDKGYQWPVIFDGQGGKGELSDKLNVGSVPYGVLFNQQGTLVRIAVKSNQLAPEVMKLGIKAK